MLTPLGKADDRLTERLRGRGQRVTPQRLVIHRVLHVRQRHLTADEVREAVADVLPGLSLPTVYATLDLLVELNFARRVDAGTGAALYDARTEPHHHMACRACGRVEDLDAWVDPEPLLVAARDAGFEPTAASVVVTGLCGLCSARRH
jgi:Fe2+ or Zn2+ uptake regulation protein